MRKSVSSISPGKKPRVYMSFWGSLARTPVTYEPVDTAGGINCAAGILPAYLGTVATIVPLEQIVTWQPDVFLVQGNYPPRERPVTVEDVLLDKRFGSLPAVRNKKVFYTFGYWYWWDPAEVLVETLYLARLFYPERCGSCRPRNGRERDLQEILRDRGRILVAYAGVLECREMGCRIRKRRSLRSFSSFCPSS